MKDDIYDRKKCLDSLVDKIEDSDDISDKDKQLLLKLKDHCFSEDLSVSRTERYLTSLETLLLNLDFSFFKASKDDIKRVVGKINKSEINGKDYAKWTKKDVT